MTTIRTITIGALTLLTASLIGCSGPSMSQQVARDMTQQSADYQEWWQQEIIYYSDVNVYFAPQTRTYYWFDHGQWKEGPDLPADIHLGRSSPSVVRRSQLLRASLNSSHVMAFNPYYELPRPVEAADDEVFTFIEDEGFNDFE